MKIKQFVHYFALAYLAACFITGCGQKKSDSTHDLSGPKPKKTEYAFALVAKSQSNPVFQAARTGAEDAAVELGKNLGVKITVLWRTPDEDDAQQQADYVEQLVLQGVDGISVDRKSVV